MGFVDLYDIMRECKSFLPLSYKKVEMERYRVPLFLFCPQRDLNLCKTVRFRPRSMMRGTGFEPA